METNKTPAEVRKALRAAMPIIRQFVRRNQLAEVIQEDGGLIPVTKVLADAEAAIASPERNCDLYPDELSAWQAFSEPRQGPDSSTEEYEGWLFEKTENGNASK